MNQKEHRKKEIIRVAKPAPPLASDKSADGTRAYQRLQTGERLNDNKEKQRGEN